MYLLTLFVYLGFFCFLVTPPLTVVLIIILSLELGRKKNNNKRNGFWILKDWAPTKDLEPDGSAEETIGKERDHRVRSDGGANVQK